MAPAPSPLRRVAFAAFAPSLLFGIAEGAILPVVPLTARELGASVPVAALVATAIGIGSLVSNIPASWITMRHGERRAIVAAALWCAAAMALCAATTHLALFAAGCFMVGMSQAVFSLARQSYLTEVVPLAYRARALSTLGGVMRIGLFIGPFVAAAAIHRWGLGAAYVVGIGALALAALVGARLPELQAPAPAPAGAPTAAPPTFASILRDRRGVFATLGVGVIGISLVRAARQVVVPLWADQIGLAAATTSLIYGIAAGIDMLVFYPAGRVMDRRGRSAVAVPSMLIMGAALIALPFTGTAVTLAIAAAAVGFGNGIGSGLVMTLGADHSPPAGRAHFLGLWRLLADIGSTGGPALLSLLAGALSLGAAIGAIGIVALAAAAQMGYWIPRAGQPK